MLLAALLSTLAGVAGSLELMRGRFGLGGALLAASVLALRWPHSIWSGPPPLELSRRMRRAALLAVCAVAVFFRVYYLNQPGLWGDDALNGLLAYEILDGKIRSPFKLVTHSHSTFHALSNYPIAAAFWLFGADLTTLRLPGIVFSILCVPLLYGTMAPLFGSSMALLAALFEATSPPQLTHAKELVQIGTGQFFHLAGMCLFVRGIAGGRVALVALSGLPLAMCLYTYHSARIAPLVAVAYGIAVWVARRRAVTYQRLGAPASIDTQPAALRLRPLYAFTGVLLVFALTLVPAVPGYVQQPGAFVQRVGETSLLGLMREHQSLWPLWENVWRTLLVFHYKQGPEYHWFGIGFDPAVNPVIGFLFLHGFIASLVRWRDPRHLLLLAWFTIGMLPALLSTGAPRLYRASFALPPLYVWAALPLVRLASTAMRGWSQRGLRALAIALVAAVPMIDFNYYFYRVYTHPTFRFFQGERIVEMARTLRAFGPGWTGYLLTDNFDTRHEDFRFLSRAWDLHLVPVKSLADVLPLPTLPERGALFILSEGALGAAAAIELVYPGSELIERREPAPRGWWFDRWWRLAPRRSEPDISAAFYPVDRAAAEHPRLDGAWGLEAEYRVANRVTKRREYPFYYFLASAFSNPFSATWRGRITIPEPGGYRIVVSTNAEWTLYVDRKAVTGDDPIPAGEHELALQLRNAPAALRLRIYWIRPGAWRDLVPPKAFKPQP